LEPVEDVENPSGTADGALEETKLAGARWRGARPRCPFRGKRRVTRGGVVMHETCQGCDRRLVLGPGDFSRAVMIAQFLIGLATIPALFLRVLLTDVPLGTMMAITLAVLVAALAVFHRNALGLRMAFLAFSDAGQEGRAALEP
jgi:uncharacterized protein (DUF983 family)